jgi:hypothetical protein
MARSCSGTSETKDKERESGIESSADGGKKVEKPAPPDYRDGRSNALYEM